MKRIISLFTAVILLLAIMVPNGIVFALEQPYLEITNAEGEYGEQITVEVSLKNSPGFGGMAYDITYDNSVLKLISYTLDLGKNICTDSGVDTYNDKVNFQYAGTSNIEGDGILVSLTFEIIGTNAGDSDITVIPEDGTTFYYEGRTEIDFTLQNAVGTVTVKVKPVSVTGVTIDKTLSLKTGETKTPGYTVNPAEASNKTVSFKSDNTAVATVNETTGEVTGVKEGTATITITTVDGNFTDTCVVTVACSHANKTPVAAKASDCKNQGWDAYVKCDDCGQLFAENGTTEIAEIPFRPLSQQHIGGTATCTAQAVCTVCGNPYGITLDHNYTAETKKAEALKTEGNCRDKAVYWYSCSACGKVENNDSHTFLGDKVSGTHVGGTTLVNPSEANHNTQTNGYTGDTKCLGCGEIIDYGDPIPAGAHTPANVWSNDGEYHWKECTVVGCGIVIDGSKATHSSTGANVATCNKKAVCDVCNVSYGDFAAHDWNTTAREKDASGHWHKCNTTGCTEKNDFAGHTPDHQGGATEEYPIKCTVCGWIIEQQLAHNHVFNQEVVGEQYLASKANCTDPAKYYKSCRCGEKGTETFTSGTKFGHTEGTAWEKDATNHWHICTVAGCGVVIESSKAAHTRDHQGSATEEYPITCSVCGWIIEQQLAHTHVFDKEVVDEQYKVSGATCLKPATYYKSCACGEKGTETFENGGVIDHTEGTEWKSDEDNHWHICTVAGCGVVIESSKAAHTPDRAEATETDAVKCSVCEFVISPALGHTHAYEAEWKSDTNNHWNECACGDKTNTAVHKDENADGKCDVCAYNVGTPSDNPQTGDNSMMWLWIALLFVSGFGVVVTTILGKKRSVR